jgi:histidyl-tRNA synthetase
MKVSNNNKVSTASYKGVRDFYPDDQFIQNHIFRVMKDTVESFGYTEYSASILEPEALYQSKSSEEILKEQTYSFKDRGGRDIVLRPEMTPTTARMIAAKCRELSFPARWYSIPNIFRYERPQRGRLREHWQLNVDLIGLRGQEADIEIIRVAHAIMLNFGLSEDMFEIRINDRAVLESHYKKRLDLDDDTYKAFLSLLDKKDKLDSEKYQTSMTELIGLSKFDEMEKMNETRSYEDSLKEIIETLSSKGVRNAFCDKHLVRGFEYYTGVIFEIYDKNPANKRSLFGGGRYDDLISLFEPESIPAVGFGMGDVGIRDVLETYELVPEYRSPSDLYICILESRMRDGADNFADKLRSKGLKVAVDYTYKKISHQVRKADRDKIPFVVCFGEEEFLSNTYKIKNLASGEEHQLKADEIALFIKNSK